jgi:hypothetical protein
MTKAIERLANASTGSRLMAAIYWFSEGTARIASWIGELQKDENFRNLIVPERFERPQGYGLPFPKLTVGIAVFPKTFESIRSANGSPPLANVPPDRDVLEFELVFHQDPLPPLRVDILTTKTPGGGGAIDRFLQKFGEGIQQVEIDVTDVDRATQILRERFRLEPIYPATVPGADGTRINFFLVPTHDGKKVLVELVEQPKRTI